MNGKIFLLVSLLVLLAYTLFLAFILGWGLISSLKSGLDFILFPGNLFPSRNFGGFHFENYVTAFQGMKVPLDRGKVDGFVYADTMLLYSLYWTVGSAFLNTFTITLVSYCCARFKNRMFSKIIYFVTVFAISIPLIGTMPSQMKLVTKLGLYNNLLLMPAFKISFISTYFLVFYSLFVKIPVSYREAAEIDGAGHWTIFLRITLPMVSNTFIAVFILLFIQYWNDYSVPMMFLPSYPTLAQGLYELMNGQASRDPNMHSGVKLAAAFIVALPPFVLFIVFRKKIMENVSMGGIKG
ncbi:MAG: carbohydrate ABC transporter permease [Candidatus Gallimonas sp.]